MTDPNAKRKVGFFGGTFDPIHHGHLNLALSIFEYHGLDEVLFSPANFSPEKETSPPIASKKARKTMTKLAIEEIPAFSLIELELEREGPSYTVETIEYLIQKKKGVQFYLILGEDILDGLSSWKEVDRLLSLAPPLVGTRPGNGVSGLSEPLKSVVEKGKTPISPMEISSTVLRERLAQKKYCGHLMSPKVLDFIQIEGLY